ncbi:MAG: hypothetical protein CEN90_218 [Parcubacteria group bacterium Licking1014_17]|nr:MAG: hypothetical protein CEN90_218 [Parcubacteria group bacterium Licking1014_17]
MFLVFVASGLPVLGQGAPSSQSTTAGCEEQLAKVRQANRTLWEKNQQLQRQVADLQKRVADLLKQNDKSILVPASPQQAEVARKNYQKALDIAREVVRPLRGDTNLEEEIRATVKIAGDIFYALMQMPPAILSNTLPAEKPPEE